MSIEDPLLIIAEAVLGAATLGDTAAILCSRFVRNYTLPGGNKRVAPLAASELMPRNHGISILTGQDTLAAAVERLATRERFEAAFAARIRTHVSA